MENHPNMAIFGAVHRMLKLLDAAPRADFGFLRNSALYKMIYFTRNGAIEAIVPNYNTDKYYHPTMTFVRIRDRAKVPLTPPRLKNTALFFDRPP